MSTYLPSIFGDSVMDVFDEISRDFFNEFGNADRMLYGKNTQRMMKTDVRETDEGYEVDIDLPGFRKDEIRLELNQGYMTVSAEKALEKNAEDNKGRMLRQERWSGTMNRSFYVGDAVTEDDIRASYNNGVLHIMLAGKDKADIPEKKQILIEG